MTGLQCASELANIYLSEFDRHIRDIVAPRCYFRYIDDGLLLLDQQWTQSQLLQELNNWDPTIQVDDGNPTTRTHYLDLDLQLYTSTNGNCHLTYRTYRKPQNNYNYVPATSQHHHKVTTGIIHTETLRLLRTNATRQDYQHQLEFFKRKLIRRGYNAANVDQVFDKYRFEDKYRILHKQRHTATTRKFIFQQYYTTATKRTPTPQILRRRLHLIHKHLKVQKCDIIVARRSKPNLFRMMHKHTWRRGQSRAQ